MKNDNQILVKSKSFAIRIIKLYQYLAESKKEFVISKQLLRCGTSIGANVREAVYAQSKKDFTSKMIIALKECSETGHWLELLQETGYLSAREFKAIWLDYEEILRLLTSIVKTSKARKNS